MTDHAAMMIPWDLDTPETPQNPTVGAVGTALREMHTAVAAAHELGRVAKGKRLDLNQIVQGTDKLSTAISEYGEIIDDLETNPAAQVQPETMQYFRTIGVILDLVLHNEKAILANAEAQAKVHRWMDGSLLSRGGTAAHR